MLTTTVCIVHYDISANDDESRGGVYVIPFRYFADSDVKAILSDSTNTYSPLDLEFNADYTVSGYEDEEVASGAGSLTRINNWDFDKYDTLTVYRDTEGIQPVDLLNGNRINADNLEWLMDRLYARMQELRDYQLRSVHVSKTDTTIPAKDGADDRGVYQFGNIADRSSSFLFFDSDGTLGQYPVSKYEELVSTFEGEIVKLEARADEVLKMLDAGLMTEDDLKEVMG